MDRTSIMGKASSNKKNRKNNVKQGRPQGFLPPRLAETERRWVGGRFRADSMPEAVRFIELMNAGQHLEQKIDLDQYAVFRFTEAAFDAAHEHHVRVKNTPEFGFDVSALPATKGVLLWDDPQVGNFCGLRWDVNGEGLLDIEMLSSIHLRNPHMKAIFHEVNPRTSIRSISTTQLKILMPTGAVDAHAVAEALAITTLMRLAAGAPSAFGRSVGTQTVVRDDHEASGRTAHEYEVRTVAEDGAYRAERARGSHAGWKLQFKSQTRGFFRKNGTWVEGYVRGAHLPERRRPVVGTTIRPAVAA